MSDQEWLREIKGSLKRVNPHEETLIDALEFSSSLDWVADSLMIVELTLDLEEHLDVEIPDSVLPYAMEELRSLTIQQLIEHIRRHVD